jgi:hypothetical protein
MLLAKYQNTRFVAGAFEFDLIAVLWKNVRRIAPPFNENHRSAAKGFFQTKLGGFARIVYAKEIDVLDRRLTLVVVPKGEGRAKGLIGSVKCPHDRSHQGRLAGAQRPREGNDVPGLQAPRKCRRKCVGSLLGGKAYAQCGGLVARSRSVSHECR